MGLDAIHIQEIVAKAGARNNRADLTQLQQMHDVGKQIHDSSLSLGATCTCADGQEEKPEGETAESEVEETEEKPVKGNALKSISETETEYRTGNHIVLFGNPSQRPKSHSFNPSLNPSAIDVLINVTPLSIAPMAQPSA